MVAIKSYNSGGIAQREKRILQHGGGAWSGAASDEEVLGSEQDRILSITGQSGLEGQQGLEDITETFEMSSGPDPNDMSGWHEMFLDLQGKGEIPGDWDFNDFMQNLGALDISPTDFSAQGGYKTRPGYADAGPVDMPYDPEEEDKTYLERIIEKLLASEMLNTPNRVGRTAIDEWEQSEFNTAKWLQKVPVLRDIMDKEIEAAAHKRPMAFRAEGGIADLDMTGGGASFGPGTGTSDDIPAMLSDGEFVVTAKAVENLGGGDRMTGARRMYQMMNQLDPASQTPAEMSTVGIA